MVYAGTIKGGRRQSREGLPEDGLMSTEGAPGSTRAGEAGPRIVPTEEGHRILIEVDFLPRGGWIPRVVIELKDLDARGRAYRRLPCGGVCYRTREDALAAGERAGRVYAEELHRQYTRSDRGQAGATEGEASGSDRGDASALGQGH